MIQDSVMIRNTVAVILILLLAAFAIAQILQRQSAQSQVALLQRQFAEMSAKLAEKPKVDTLSQQAKCAEQSHKDFEDWGYSKKESPDFVSHYNRKFDKCFVQFQNLLSSNPSVFFWRELYDAYGGKQYGRYGSEHDVNSLREKIISCEIEVEGEEQVCNSEEEFLKLARHYMEE
jgi:hypothetical protein